MNDLDFKLTLIKALEHNANTQSAFNTEGIWKIISSLRSYSHCISWLFKKSAR